MTSVIIDFTGLKLGNETIIKEFCAAYVSKQSFYVKLPILIDTTRLPISPDVIYESKDALDFYKKCKIIWNKRSNYVDDHLLILMHDLLKYDVYVRDIKHAEFLVDYFAMEENPFKLLTDEGFDSDFWIMKTECRNHLSRNSYCVEDNVTYMAMWLRNNLNSI